MSDADSPAASILENMQPELVRRRRWRGIKDIVARHSVAIGGVSVIIAIVLIFFYLLIVVLPLFESTSIETVSNYPLPQSTVTNQKDRESGATELLALEEQNEIGVRFTDSGSAIFFAANNGTILKEFDLPIPDNAEITSFAEGNVATDNVAYGMSNGNILIARHKYKLTYPDDKRVINPEIEYPFGEQGLQVDEQGRAIQVFAFRGDGESLTVAALLDDNTLILTSFVKQESLLEDDVSFETTSVELGQSIEADSILLDKEQRHLFVTDNAGNISHYDISDKEDPSLIETTSVVDPGNSLTAINFLAGELSLLIGDSSGVISQWFLVRDEFNNMKLNRIRQFKLSNNPIGSIAQEERRKGFIATDIKGAVGVFHSTAERNLVQANISSPVANMGLSPRATAVLLQDENKQVHLWALHNEHPEISWSSIWGEVWYESYDKPRYVWQSSSASNDFEPKFSLTPLVFGTLKGAFYAMLFAIPLAILGAIYTAYFMAPKMRQMVKPSIETMEALPTVILGFLAGLWFAPFVESHLPGIFSLLLVLPVGVLIVAFCWQWLPGHIRHRVPDGWTAALLIPVVIFIGWFSIAMSQPLELWFFNGGMRGWLTNDIGIGFDQRNALVVGFAMGLAVIPSIFSIAEDAIFSVPKHLTFGSLALGATPWQTLVRVVLLTASPGIFSAIMIGLGRAVGETMIVLMATGNTPVMDMSIFQGMRTLAANIAVEMPESEVDSSHYRVLFLAALVLFMFTFFFNTLAEIIRQRLREKYSSL